MDLVSQGAERVFDVTNVRENNRSFQKPSPTHETCERQPSASILRPGRTYSDPPGPCRCAPEGKTRRGCPHRCGAMPYDLQVCCTRAPRRMYGRGGQPLERGPPSRARGRAVEAGQTTSRRISEVVHVQKTAAGAARPRGAASHIHGRHLFPEACAKLLCGTARARETRGGRPPACLRERARLCPRQRNEASASPRER